MIVPEKESPFVPGERAPNGAAVLIADDDHAIRVVLRHRLEAEGCTVEEASDSASALELLRTGRFDVALLDIIMPGSGGLEVLSAAKAEGVRTLIVVITAASTMSNAVEAMKRGAHDYLTKPFANLDLVAAAVKRAVCVGYAWPVGPVRPVCRRYSDAGAVFSSSTRAGFPFTFAYFSSCTFSSVPPSVLICRS